MPVHNSENTLKRAIDSVILQEFENWELFVIIDHCTDSSENIAKSYHDKRIFVFENQNNKGAAATRNIGIKKAQGWYLAFLDSDDYWVPKKLSLQLDFMEKRNVSFSYSPYYVICDGKKTFLFKPPSLATFDRLLKTNYIGCSTVILEKNIIPDFKMPTDIKKREDLGAWLSVLKTGIVAYCFDKPMVFYQINKYSTSGNKIEMARLQWDLLRKAEKQSITKSIFYLFSWAWNGFWKYRSI